jgi:hypothetical protein
MIRLLAPAERVGSAAESLWINPQLVRCIASKHEGDFRTSDGTIALDLASLPPMERQCTPQRFGLAVIEAQNRQERLISSNHWTWINPAIVVALDTALSATRIFLHPGGGEKSLILKPENGVIVFIPNGRQFAIDNSPAAVAMKLGIKLEMPA